MVLPIHSLLMTHMYYHIAWYVIGGRKEKVRENRKVNHQKEKENKMNDNDFKRGDKSLLILL